MNELIEEIGGDNKVIRTVVLCALGAISVPFWVGAVMLAWKALEASGPALAKAHLCQATVFTLGLALGLASCGLALSSASERTRNLGIAGTLLGSSFIILSIVMAWTVKRATTGQPISPLPFTLPSLLVFAALMSTSKTLKFSEKSEDDGEFEQCAANEPQPLPLSPP